MPACQPGLERQVRGHVQRGDQVELLEHQPHRAPAQGRAFRVAEDDAVAESVGDADAEKEPEGLDGSVGLADVAALPAGDGRTPTHILPSLGDLPALLERWGVGGGGAAAGPDAPE